VQRRAKRSKETPLDMGDLQARATPCNARPITRNEQGVSGSSPLVGSPEYAFFEVVIVMGRLI
jgi:hypothetical protein